MTLESVRREGTPALVEALLDRILPADLWRYFTLIPEADDAWWSLLVDGVRDLWGERGLVDSVLPPVHRLTGWLVAHDRRADAETVIGHLRDLDGRRVARVGDQRGVRLDVPGLDPTSVAYEAIAVRPARPEAQTSALGSKSCATTAGDCRLTVTSKLSSVSFARRQRGHQLVEDGGDVRVRLEEVGADRRDEVLRGLDAACRRRAARGPGAPACRRSCRSRRAGTRRR